MNKLSKLEAFFKKVARLTSHHDEIAGTACVTADKLGRALSDVNPDWWKGISPMTKHEQLESLKK